MKLETQIMTAAESMAEMYVDLINGEVFNSKDDWSVVEVVELNEMRRDLRDIKKFMKDFANGGINYDRVVMAKIVNQSRRLVFLNDTNIGA
jgi:glucose-6-phosphate isomerase